MAKNEAEKKGTAIGLDIGSRLIKLIEVSFEAGAPKLTKLSSKEIAQPPTEEKISNSLKSLFQSCNPSVRDVSIGLSAPSAIVRFIDMPKMKPEDLKNSLRFEAEKYIPFNINDVIVDAVILDKVTAEKNQMKVLLAAAKKQVINSRIEMVKALGFSVSVIDIDSFACFNAFSNAAGDLDESKSVAIVNLGYSQANVVISRGSQPFFTRDIQMGAKDMAQDIAKTLSISEAEADRLIYQPGEKEKEILEAAKPVLESLADELRLSFGYYENQYGKSIHELYLSGGGARTPGIAEFFEENLGMHPAEWNPFAKFETDTSLDANFLDETKVYFAVCAGLALRGPR